MDRSPANNGRLPYYIEINEECGPSPRSPKGGELKKVKNEESYIIYILLLCINNCGTEGCYRRNQQGIRSHQNGAVQLPPDQDNKDSQQCHGI